MFCFYSKVILTDMCPMSTGVLIGSRASGRHNHNGSFLGYDGKTKKKKKKN